MKFWDFVFGNRYGLAIWCIIIGLLIPIILGAIFGLIMGGYFWASIQSMFWYCGAPSVVAGLLLILTPISEDLAVGFGCGLYYGTVLASKVLPPVLRVLLNSNPLFIGFLLSALVCYIVYCKFF